MSDEQPETEYEIVMPFVTVTSKGGPHDDESYVAGYAMGLLDSRLTICEAFGLDASETIRSTSQDQAELIAMKHGYVMDIKDSEIDGWMYALFRRTL